MATNTLTSTVLPDERAISAAAESKRRLAAFLSTTLEAHRIELVSASQHRETIELPTSALRLLGEILGEFAQGNAVRVVAIHAELTTQEAADLLNVSRPHLVKLLDEGALPYAGTGRHRRVRFSDLMAYKQQREQLSYRTMEELVAQAQELKMGYE